MTEFDKLIKIPSQSRGNLSIKAVNQSVLDTSNKETTSPAPCKITEKKGMIPVDLLYIILEIILQSRLLE